MGRDPSRKPIGVGFFRWRTRGVPARGDGSATRRAARPWSAPPAARMAVMGPHAHPGPAARSLAERRRPWEEAELSPLAARSWPARRRLAEDDCGLRSPLQRDRDRIVHCKAFRRLKHKTQVFVAPEGDHFRTRLTHTIEVTQISRTVARALDLNEDLVEAIGLGHDLGHPPFGHIGEAVLDRCLAERYGGGVRHHEDPLRGLGALAPEPRGAGPGGPARAGRGPPRRPSPPVGLTLCEDVRDGILCHSGRAPMPRTLEGRIVRLVDRVSYLNHDIDDAIRAGVLREDELPPRPIAVLGETGSRRIDTLVHDLVETSAVAGDIVQGDEAGAAMDELRSFMFEHVYLGPAARREHEKIERVVRVLFDWYADDPMRLPDGGGAPDADVAQRVTDYIAGMTDRYCIRAFEALAVPEAFAL